VTTTLARGFSAWSKSCARTFAGSDDGWTFLQILASIELENGEIYGNDSRGHSMCTAAEMDDFVGSLLTPEVRNRVHRVPTDTYVLA